MTPQKPLVEKKYVIVENNGLYRIEIRRKFLWWSCWSYLTGPRGPRTFYFLDVAKDVVEAMELADKREMSEWTEIKR